jgi:hypothetical protein
VVPGHLHLFDNGASAGSSSLGRKDDAQCYLSDDAPSFILSRICGSDFGAYLLWLVVGRGEYHVGFDRL